MNPTRDGAGPPGHRPPTYYSRDGVYVIGRWLVVDGHRYSIAELRNVRCTRTRPDPLAVNAGIGLALVAVVAVLTARFVGPPGWLAAGVALLVFGVLLLVGLRRRPRERELWAEYHGLSVRLLSMRNDERYNQVCRAVLRAKEAISQAG